MVSPGRRVLTITPDCAWLVIAGERWGVETRREAAVPLARSRLWLLPLLDRPREEVEAEALLRLSATDPDLSEPLNAMIGAALSAPSEYYVSRVVGWLKTEEVLAFATDLRKVALGRSCSQATRHAIKGLLKRHGVWATHRRGGSAHEPPA
jgi:hypothetical protein